MSNSNAATITEVEEEVQEHVKLYPKWKVLLHNDDKTTMQYVIYSLMRFFGHNQEAAQKIMMEVHVKGIGLAGVYAKEQAEFKRDQVISDARTHKWPLYVSIEPEEA